MLYPFGQVDQWGDRASVPDISKLETRMYFYYRAIRFIDAGFESLHFGQINIMDNLDGGHVNTIDLFNKIRAYAAQHARRGFVLLDSHASNGGIVESGQLLFDIGCFPARPKEQCGTPYEAILETNYRSSIYGKTVGGITPSGWYCDRIPYNVELDNFGADNPGVCRGATSEYVWGWDESTWFAHCTNAYRNYWLGYAVSWLKTNDNIGYLRPNGRRTISPDPIDINGDGKLEWEYRANTPTASAPDGFGQEETIKALWAEPSALPPLQQWRLTYFGTTNTAGLAANAADWDSDGLKNIFEYAFNTNPTNANASPVTFSCMKLHALDLFIIVAYFVVVVLIGLWVSRRGQRIWIPISSAANPCLGTCWASPTLPACSTSAGTMWLVYILFLYGLKSIWLPWMWPTFNQIFLMMFLSAWLRRSNVLTGAQWMQTRFGTDRGATLAHLSVVFFALVNVIGLLAYAFKGIGKFAAGCCRGISRRKPPASSPTKTSTPWC
jgi:hypothetical protein